MRTHLGFGLAMALATLGACGQPAPKAAGEACVASSECGPGLVCDTGLATPVCSDELTPRPDADPGAPDASTVDADPNAPDADPGAPDAAPDAMVDAAPDAMVDAAPDAMVDAAPDAMVDAAI